MDVTVTPYKHCSVVKLNGRLDSDTVPGVEEKLKSLTDAGQHRLVLDMTDVNFVSSKGWWLLIEMQKICKRFARGELVLACLEDRIRRSLIIVGMRDYFQIFDDVISAVGHF